ncbi:Uu.00g032490.m01.CDS01 [Anthostomella pinea]|uniref:Uu.00g032490.m01.CDS01 n=1 Tax=Anthostomella pinea TaxID=933095 RepID=A0AAI8V9Q7_9PEZI|nr:Uu.00g032490.m01.CDS01 [Anthostomella pinea]
MDSATNGHAPNWEPLLEQPAFTPTRKMRVVCIGAGFSGLMVAYKIQHDLKLEDELDLAIYDHNSDVGGTCPGAACDIPAHGYIFPFEPNPDWSGFYVGQQEILAYIKRTTEKYGLNKNLQLNTKILETIWDEDSGKWKIKLEHDGKVMEDEADVLINATGFLNNWEWPDIKGLKDFKGKLVHTAGWDNSYEWEGKKVAVIGNGASGIQAVATMQPKVEKLVNYIRNPTWIAVNFLVDKAPETSSFKYPEEQRKIWKNDPKAFFEYRQKLEQALNGFFFAMVLDHPFQHGFEGANRERMHQSLMSDPQLEKRMSPPFHAGCRRITPGDGYLEALQQPNCRDSWEAIECITEKGIKTSTGVEEFDLIVCATGFVGSYIPQWKLTGRNGVTLEEKWRGDPEAFLGAQVDDMPNYFMVTGPNMPLSHGTVLGAMCWMTDYITKWIRRMSRQDIKTVCVKKDAVSDFNEFAQELLRRSVWSGDCRSFYKNGKRLGKITALYPGSIMHFKNALEEIGFNGENFDFTWWSRNRFRCLGNGTAVSDQDGMGNLAPYM